MLQTLSLAGQEYVVIAKSDYDTLASHVGGDDEHFPADFVNRLFDSDNRITVWREYRGLTMSALAEAAGISQSYLSDIENGKKDGSIKVLKRIAQALNADLDLIV